MDSLQGGVEAPRSLLTAMGPPVTTHNLQEENVCLVRTILGSKATLVDLRIDPLEQGPCPSLGCDPELLVSPLFISETSEFVMFTVTISWHLYKVVIRTSRGSGYAGAPVSP